VIPAHIGTYGRQEPTPEIAHIGCDFDFRGSCWRNRTFRVLLVSGWLAYPDQVHGAVSSYAGVFNERQIRLVAIVR